MKEVLKTMGLIFLGMLLFVTVPIIPLLWNTAFGVVMGVILSVCLTHAIVMTMLSFSNSLGASEGSYEDFTDEPMKVEEL